MNKVEVLFLYDSEQDDYEAASRGFRKDIYVKIGGEYYNIRAYHIVRLQQDVESEISEYGYFVPEPNMVLVNSMNKDDITSTLLKLCQTEGTFIKQLIKIDSRDLGKLRNQSKWGFFNEE
ncbi:hypothetical protein AV540_12245 [Brevibacillus parabrevis]|uniref:hypothetical protein n=1 Tax=Brevibacillus parabrevis TaxID=54914 RepID=UPI0007AC20F7|nr:hypothetical protein [Brevibacillus parabrevis]KZE51635.1 hypothetical protein AV540_12245 [Brevibacillus parabrevis]